MRRSIALASALQTVGALLLTLSAWGHGWGDWALLIFGAFTLILGSFGMGYEEGKEEGINHMLWLDGVNKRLDEWKRGGWKMPP